MRREVKRLVVSVTALVVVLIAYSLPATAMGCTECLPGCPPGSSWGEATCEEACGIEGAEWECSGGSQMCNPGEILINCWGGAV